MKTYPAKKPWIIACGAAGGRCFLYGVSRRDGDCHRAAGHGKSFGVQAVDMNIGISAYLITLAVLIPASGWIADRFGARKVFALALAIFTLASVFCGLSTTLDQFVAMRVLQGMGGALMVPMGRLAVLRTTPKHQLITAIATLTWPALVAPIIGPPLGWVHYQLCRLALDLFINVPLGIIAICWHCASFQTCMKIRADRLIYRVLLSPPLPW
ncbi:MFS transporter [Enterobacter hormaechei]